MFGGRQHRTQKKKFNLLRAPGILASRGETVEFWRRSCDEVALPTNPFSNLIDTLESVVGMTFLNAWIKIHRATGEIHYIEIGSPKLEDIQYRISCGSELTSYVTRFSGMPKT